MSQSSDSGESEEKSKNAIGISANLLTPVVRTRETKGSTMRTLSVPVCISISGGPSVESFVIGGCKMMPGDGSSYYQFYSILGLPSSVYKAVILPLVSAGVKESSIVSRDYDDTHVYVRCDMYKTTWTTTGESRVSVEKGSTIPGSPTDMKYVLTKGPGSACTVACSVSVAGYLRGDGETMSDCGHWEVIVRATKVAIVP